MFFGILLNCVAYITQRGTGLNRLYSLPHGLVGFIDQSLGIGSHIANQIHLAGVSNKAVFLQGNVDIDDIACFEYLLVGWNAMAHHVVD